MVAASVRTTIRRAPSLVSPEASSPPDPYLSVVVTTRNDNHGGDLLFRTQAFVNGLCAQCDRFNLPTELILVEWNPPAFRPKLVEALAWPEDGGNVTARIIEVSEELHRAFRHSDRLPLYQMIAKNVGIRRARGQFVLATNIDIIFSDALMRFLVQRRLRSGRFYRVDRYDIVGVRKVDAPIEEQLRLCSESVIRICGRYGTLDLRTGDFYRVWLKYARLPWWAALTLQGSAAIARRLQRRLRALFVPPARLGRRVIRTVRGRDPAARLRGRRRGGAWLGIGDRWTSLGARSARARRWAVSALRRIPRAWRSTTTSASHTAARRLVRGEARLLRALVLPVGAVVHFLRRWSAIPTRRVIRTVRWSACLAHGSARRSRRGAASVWRLVLRLARRLLLAIADLPRLRRSPLLRLILRGLIRPTKWPKGALIGFRLVREGARRGFRTSSRAGCRGIGRVPQLARSADRQAARLLWLGRTAARTVMHRARSTVTAAGQNARDYARLIPAMAHRALFQARRIASAADRHAAHYAWFARAATRTAVHHGWRPIAALARSAAPATRAMQQAVLHPIRGGAGRLLHAARDPRPAAVRAFRVLPGAPRKVARGFLAAVRHRRRRFVARWQALREAVLWAKALPALHTNACGDFTLLSRLDWFALRAYPELHFFSMFIDSLLIYMAYWNGLQEKFLSYPIYHLEHSSGFKPDKESISEMNKRLDKAGIPQIDNAQFRSYAIEMYRQRKPLDFNGDDWGFADLELPETVVCHAEWADALATAADAGA